jgi:hypothetical protein
MNGIALIYYVFCDLPTIQQVEFHLSIPNLELSHQQGYVRVNLISSTNIVIAGGLETLELKRWLGSSSEYNSHRICGSTPALWINVMADIEILSTPSDISRQIYSTAYRENQNCSSIMK